MGTIKYDYQDLERQFVHGLMSLRQLCAANGITSWSSVTVQAKKRDWVGKRADFQRKLSESQSKAVIEGRVDRLEKALDDAIMVANAAVFSFFDSLKDRWVEGSDGTFALVPAQTIPPGDFVRILEKIMVLNGQVTSRDAHLSMEVSADQLTMEMLHDLADAARAAGADARPVSSSPLPRLEGPRSVN